MKIKTKKKMTPEEYAKYMIDNHGIRGYESKLIDNYLPGAPERFSQKFELNPTLKEDVLTGSFRNGELEVEVEEEITEDTVFELLLEVRNRGTVIPFYNKSVKSQVDKVVKEYHAYIDGEFKLIWTHEKGLVG